MMMKKFITTTTAVFIIVSSLSGCYFFPNEEELLDPPTIKVEDVTYSTYKVAQKAIVSQNVATGYVTSKVSNNCFFTELSGKLKTIYVDPGDVVKEGDLIAELNMGDLDYQLKNQDLVVQRAQAKYAASGSTADQLTVEIEKNKLAQIQNQYDNSKIYAPSGGTVSFVETMRSGDEIEPYKVLATIVDPNNLFVKATVNQNNSFKINDSISIRINEETFEGVIVKTPKEAAEQGDEDTNSIYAEFKNGLPSFTTIGTIADIVLTINSVENAVVVPKYLVKTLNDRTFVELLVNDEKKEVDITLGINNATEVQVLTGLKAGDIVVVK